MNNRNRQRSKVYQKCLSEEQKMALDVIREANNRVLEDAKQTEHMDSATYMHKLIEYTMDGVRRYYDEQASEEEIRKEKQVQDILRISTSGDISKNIQTYRPKE